MKISADGFYRRQKLKGNRPHRPERFAGTADRQLYKTRKITGFRALYFHYCYLLGIFPENKPKQNRRLHFLLREDLRKLDTITAETRLLVKYRIDTSEQLFHTVTV